MKLLIKITLVLAVSVMTFQPMAAKKMSRHIISVVRLKKHSAATSRVQWNTSTKK